MGKVLSKITDEVGISAARGIFSPDGVAAPVIAVLNTGPVP